MVFAPALVVVNDVNAASFIHRNGERFAADAHHGFGCNLTSVGEYMKRRALPSGGAAVAAGHGDGPRATGAFWIGKVIGHHFAQGMHHAVVRQHVGLDDRGGVGLDSLVIKGDVHDARIVVRRQILPVVQVSTFVHRFDQVGIQDVIDELGPE